jgi:hypothetical protein
MAEVAAGANVEPGAFSTSVEAAQIGAAENPSTVPASSTPRTPVTSARQSRNPSDAFGQLEAFVLQTFIQSMLPKNAQHVYGKGTAGEVWKSMLAEKLGNEIARSGQMGIAKRLASGRAELTASRSDPLGTGALTLPPAPSASVASAFLTAQSGPPQTGKGAETVAPQPSSSSERS